MRAGMTPVVDRYKLAELQERSMAAGVPYRIDLVRVAAGRWPDALAVAGIRNHPRQHEFIKKLAAFMAVSTKGTPEEGRWGLNGKRGNVDDLSDDVIAYKGAGIAIDRAHGNAPMEIIDVIASAGAPNASAAWAPGLAGPGDVGAWVAPDLSVLEGGGASPVPPAPKPPPVLPYPGDHVFDAIGYALEADMQAAGQSLNAQSARWFGRVVWDVINGDPSGRKFTLEESIAKHRNEWRAVLGLPLLSGSDRT